MNLQALRLYNPKGPHRLAVLSVQPSAGQAGSFLIQLARGNGPGPLTNGTVYGPYAESDLDARFAEIAAMLKAEGFVPTGLHDLLVRLDDPSSVKRARAALGLGWRRAGEGAALILDRLPKAVDEVCSYLDALGALGDAQAVPVLREHAGRKLLSRRRSAVEALRNLGDADGLAVAGQQALERLPEPIRLLMQSPLAKQDDCVQAILALKIEQRGLALDTLYELATPLAIDVTRASLLLVPFDQAHLWRYVKSIFKRAMLRHDIVTWALLSHTVELRARDTKGTQANVKSGYDGVQRQTRIFARKTQQFIRRLSWRYLRRLASYRPDTYALAAAEALILYTPNDGQEPKGLYGRFANCYLLHRILWGNSKRFTMNDRSLRFRFRSAADVAAPSTSEEAYPERWDAASIAYLRLLSAARLPEVQQFAVHAVETRHRELLREASGAELVGMLHASYEPTVKLGLAELERRFDPRHPDWTLLEHLLSTTHPAAREVGERWLRLTAPQWGIDVSRTLSWLTSSQAATRALAAELSIPTLNADANLRTTLAATLREILRGGQIHDEDADGIVTVARASLLHELNALFSLEDLLNWIAQTSRAFLPLAGDLLGRRPESIATLGVDRLGWLARHDMAAIRAGAHQILRRALDYFQGDTSMLLVLAESEWEDARQTAVELLRAALRPETLDLDHLLGFLDSTYFEVQHLGQDLTHQRLAFLPADKLVFRLAQHPDPNMRHFVLNLATQHLPDGAEPLARLETFFRAALLDLWPDRNLKDRVLNFVAERGLRDEQQAEVAVRILADVVRIQGRTDFERALESMTRLKLAYPALASPLRIIKEDAP